MSEWISSSQPYLAPGDSTSSDPWREEAARAGHVGAHRLVLVERAELGYTATRHVEEVAVVDVPQTLLDVILDSPVIELTRTSYAENDVPFEVAVMLMSRDMTPGVPRRLRYEMREA